MTDILDQKSKRELIEIIQQYDIVLTDQRDQIAELEQELTRLHDRENVYRTLLDESTDPIFSFAPDGMYRYVNNAFATGVNRNIDDIIDHKIWDVFPPDEAEKRFATVRWVFANGEIKVIEVRVPREDGDRYYITTVKPIKNEQGQVVNVICISKEITERKRMEDELRRLSTLDVLTNLHNRNFFEGELQRVWADRSFPVSLVMVDVDFLKRTNDLLGHSSGDDLIRRAAQVLRDSFRADDILARIGGDEFAVLLHHTSEEDLKPIIKRLRHQIQIENDPYFSLSIGYACGNETCTPEEIIHLADKRMYADKESRKAATRRS